MYLIWHFRVHNLGAKFAIRDAEKTFQFFPNRKESHTKKVKLRRNYGTTELQIYGTTENWLCFATPRQRTEAMPRLQDNESTRQLVGRQPELRIYGFTELRSLRIDYESGKESSWLSAHSPIPLCL